MYTDIGGVMTRLFLSISLFVVLSFSNNIPGKVEHEVIWISGLVAVISKE